MFWSAFIWGLGVTVGGSIGLMLFVFLFGLYKSKASQSSVELAEFANKALTRRNELTEKQIEHLLSISLSLESIAADAAEDEYEDEDDDVSDEVDDAEKYWNS